MSGMNLLLSVLSAGILGLVLHMNLKDSEPKETAVGPEAKPEEVVTGGKASNRDSDSDSDDDSALYSFLQL